MVVGQWSLITIVASTLTPEVQVAQVAASLSGRDTGVGMAVLRARFKTAGAPDLQARWGGPERSATPVLKRTLKISVNERRRKPIVVLPSRVCVEMIGSLLNVQLRLSRRGHPGQSIPILLIPGARR
jgi:hypothetical protein